MKIKGGNVLIIFMLLFISSCKNEFKEKSSISTETEKSGTVFKIINDTLDFSIEGYNIRKVSLFRENYYCIFEATEEIPSIIRKRMIILNLKGQFIKEIPVSSEIQSMMHYSFELDNDSLYIKRNQFEEENYLLEKIDDNFKKVENRSFKIFEDKDYLLYSNCYGEFGGTIFFKNKKTKNWYENSATCTVVVNKLNNEYYITNYLDWTGVSSVLKISDPTKLKKSKGNHNKKYGSDYNQGIENILDDFGVNIHTSFINNNELYHLYRKGNKTYIGKIENSKMVIVDQLNFNFYPTFNQQIDNHEQILIFYNIDTKESGILIIESNQLIFKYLK